MKKPYGTWQSPILPSHLSVGTLRFRELGWDGDDLYWIEGRAKDGGRYVLVRATADGKIEDVTPSPWNIRSRVHEYGGGSFLAVQREVFFCHYADQRIYRIRSGESPAPITPAVDFRYADFTADVGRRRLIAVGEDHATGAPEPANRLVALDMDREKAPVTIAEGRDFYASPRVSPDGRQLIWLCWDHPDLPWDGCELWLADLNPDGSLGVSRKLAGGPDESIFQPSFSPRGIVHFVSDRNGWWNLYRADGDRTEALCPREAEFGLPQWVFGQSTYDFDTEGNILVTYSKNGLASLGRWNCHDQKLVEIESEFREFLYLKAGRKSFAFIGGSPKRFPEIVRFDPVAQTFSTVKSSRATPIDESYLSIPEPITFATADSLPAHAFYYAPRNPTVPPADLPAGERPPLIVMSHGGPTGQTSPTLDLGIQFWTSRGFSVLDVNYGGSTGYGRAYRQRLEGQWGVVDVEDCIRGAQSLVDKGLADPNRLIIRGGSAGGYTTLCALTFHDVFRAGASYYGVSDIEALIRDTHKFESRYDHHLIGPRETSQALYRERSPIHYADRLNCPLILFQGLEDKVVPPNQSEMLFDALKKKGIPVAYVAFPNEQHGFRRSENIERSLEAELYFYSRVFGFKAAGDLKPVDIENLR